MVDTPRTPLSLLPLLAAAVPAMACALILTRTGINTAVRADILPTPSTDAMIDAVASGDFARTYRLLRAGADPNARGGFANRTLTRDVRVEITPLALAVARGDDNIVRLFVNHGLRDDDGRTALTGCMVRSLEGGAARLEAFAALLPLPGECGPHRADGVRTDVPSAPE